MYQFIVIRVEIIVIRVEIIAVTGLRKKMDSTKH